MQEIILAVKEIEHPDVVLLIAENPNAQRLLVSWKNLPRSFKKGKSEPASISEAWEQVEFDQEHWARIAHVHSGLANDLAKVLIANNLIYPDGSMNEFVQKYLNSLVITSIAKAKPKKQF